MKSTICGVHYTELTAFLSAPSIPSLLPRPPHALTNCTNRNLRGFGPVSLRAPWRDLAEEQ